MTGEGGAGSERALPRGRAPGPRPARQCRSTRPIRTRTASGIAGFDDLLTEARERAPLRRPVKPRNVGAFCACLVSDAAAITGDTHYVDRSSAFFIEAIVTSTVSTEDLEVLRNRTRRDRRGDRATIQRTGLPKDPVYRILWTENLEEVDREIVRLAVLCQTAAMRTTHRRSTTFRRPGRLAARMSIDATIVPAMAGVMGSFVGASATVATAWITQRTLNKRDLFQAEMRKREALYGEFIGECARLARRAPRPHPGPRTNPFSIAPHRPYPTVQLPRTVAPKAEHLLRRITACSRRPERWRTCAAHALPRPIRCSVREACRSGWIDTRTDFEVNDIRTALRDPFSFRHPHDQNPDGRCRTLADDSVRVFDYTGTT